jgi:hypothetical protein
MSAIYVQANIMTEVARMETEKRRGDNPVPDQGIEMLTELQRLALLRIEGFGWRLHFIRRPLFQDPVAVVVDGAGQKIGVLEEDGRINMDPDIKVRR